MKIYLGDKFYTYEPQNNKFDIYRVVRIKNLDSFVLQHEETKETIKATSDFIKTNYTKLKPDGYISFAIVDLQDGIKDTIISLYRLKDLESGEQLPYAACRQNIYDLFTNQIKEKNKTYIGVSISKDTVPEGTPYEIILSCNGISYNSMVSVYIDDTLDKILPMIKEDKYDLVLKTLKNNMSDNTIFGNCETLRQLLIENNFMYDFYNAFNIIKIPLDIEVIEETSEIIPYQREILEDYLKIEMFKTYVLEYDREIDLDKIQREYVLISDINDKLFVVAYDKGNYINRYYQQNIKDKRDVITMLKYRKNK